MHANHIYDLLETIVDYWSAHWHVPLIAVPHPKTLTGFRGVELRDRATALKESVAARRVAAYAEAYGKLPGRVVVDEYVDRSIDQVDGGQKPSDRALWAAILKRAVHDFGAGICSPRADEQRRGLNAYWWCMGLGWVNPSDIAMDVWQRPGDVLVGAAARAANVDPPPTKIPESAVVFEHLPFPVTRMFNYRGGHPPAWDGIEEGMLELLTLTSFEAVCQRLGFNAVMLRERLLLMSVRERMFSSSPAANGT